MSDQAKRNLPTLIDLSKLTEAEIAAIPVDALKALQDDILERAAQLKLDVVAFEFVCGVRFPEIVSEYVQKDEPFGTVNAIVDGHAIKAKRDKKVEWNQDFLARTRLAMIAAEDNPDVYMTTHTEYKISETAFKAWPDTVQAALRPGRTVKPAKTTYIIGEKGPTK